jgi:hypothetical protein
MVVFLGVLKGKGKTQPYYIRDYLNIAFQELVSCHPILNLKKPKGNMIRLAKDKQKTSKIRILETACPWNY